MEVAAGEAVKKVRMWSQLPTEILEAVFIKLSFLDYIYAGAVCVSWHEAAVVARNLRSAPPRTPWLMLSQDPQTNMHSFLSLHHNKIYNIHLPIAHDRKQGEKCLGSFQEWLILKNSSKGEFFLLNIISKARIQLSRQAFRYHECPTLSGPIRFGDVVGPAQEAILSSTPTSDDCIVVVLLNRRELAFCRMGNAPWTVFRPNQEDVTCIRFYAGRLHAICRLYQHIVCELDVPPKSTEFYIRPSLQIADRDQNRIRPDGIRLVELNSELLLVLKVTSHCLENCVDDYLKTLGFYVFKMDLSGPTTRLVKVDNLGDGMLFLGDKGSNCFWARGLTGFRGNCIYFTKNYVDYLSSKCDAAVFSLEDRRIKTLISKGASLPLMWFMV